jgi:hypothetical protein
MHSLFHMRNLKFLPKFYARILHQGIVLFHMRSTRATKSNNKLGSATWVLGKKSELIWRWGILLHEHHHDITIKTKGTFFQISVLYWKEPSWENSGFWDLVFFLKRSLKFEKFFILGGSNLFLAVLGFWGPFSISSRHCAECKVSSHFSFVYLGFSLCWKNHICCCRNNFKQIMVVTTTLSQRLFHYPCHYNIVLLHCDCHRGSLRNEKGLLTNPSPIPSTPWRAYKGFLALYFCTDCI